MNLLYLTPYLPRKGSHGCASKTFDDLQMLTAKHRVHLVCFVARNEKADVNILTKMPCDVHALDVETYDRLWSHHRAMTQLINKTLNNNDIDLLQCETSFMARFLPARINIPALLTMHQIYQTFFWRDFKISKNPMSLLRLVKNILDERVALNKFQRIIFFSGHDKKTLQRIIRNLPLTEIIPIGIDLDYFFAPLAEPFSFDACFVGSFANAPNRDAVAYFIREILPLILKNHPKFSLAVVGRHLPDSLRRLCRNNQITFASDVSDIRPTLNQSKIFINPMRLGSGMRTKILEAWAMAKPVVSTPTGCEGICALNEKNILIANSPAEFADKITRLLKDENLRRLLGQEGRATVQQYHDRKRSTEKLEQIYQEILAS